MFHHWMSTDAETTAPDANTRLTTVSCLGCGVITPEWGYGAPYFVSVSHGVLPITCNGPDTSKYAHYFSPSGGEDDPIWCEFCGYRITGWMELDLIDWECTGQDGS
jgi:hypothetical protein